VRRGRWTASQLTPSGHLTRSSLTYEGRRGLGSFPVLFAKAFDTYGLLDAIRRVRAKPFQSYGIAIAAVVIATLLRYPLMGSLSGSGPFTTYSLAVIVTALACGFWPSVLALLISLVTGWFLFLPPPFSFTLTQSSAWTLALFAVVSAINAALISGTIGLALRHAERQQFLVRELHHRSQNLFAVIQTIVSRTLTQEQSISEAKNVLNGRLAALAHAHGLLANAAWTGAPLKEIVAQELSHFSNQVSITACDILIDTPAAQNFALIVHELTTNAVKYGALSNSEGRVEVDCGTEGVNGEGRFRFTWREFGGPPVSEPTRTGFGSSILLNVAKQFAPKVQVKYAPEGLVYEIHAPLSLIKASQAPTVSEVGAPRSSNRI
jgi:two-component sensor histidine kinase